MMKDISVILVNAKIKYMTMALCQADKVPAYCVNTISVADAPKSTITLVDIKDELEGDDLKK